MSGKEYQHTEGPLLRSIWRLAWPAVTSMFLGTALMITDAFWVGKLGAAQMAAVTSSLFPIWTVYSMVTIISIGAAAVISRAVGAGELGEAARVGRQYISFAIYGSIVYTLLGYAGTPLIINFTQPDKDIAHIAIIYLRIYFIGSIFVFLNDTFSTIFRASGDTRAQLMASMAAIIINFFLDPILIFGLLGMPRWEAKGASVASVVAMACGTGIYFFMLARHRLPYRLGFRMFERFDLSLFRLIVKIGFPIGLSGLVFSFVYIFLNRITAEFGSAANAALLIGNRIESISYMICFGFGMAAATLVGQNLGAGKVGRATRSAWISTAVCILFTLATSTLFLLFPRSLANFFTNDAAVIPIARDYVIILALSQSFMAIEIVLEGAFTGAGNTLPPTIISIPGSIARLPLAYYLSFSLGWGVNGIWWALTITTWVKGIIMIYWFSLGRWKKTGLLHK